MNNSVEMTLDDQRNIVELELAIKKLKFQRKKKSNVKVFES